MADNNNKSSSAQGRANREKGKRFERWVANYFSEHGVSANLIWRLHMRSLFEMQKLQVEVKSQL